MSFAKPLRYLNVLLTRGEMNSVPPKPWVGWQVQVSGLMICFIQNSPPYLEDSHRQLRGSEELPRKWVRREREGQGEGETER
jgi:hypothetical protein